MSNSKPPPGPALYLKAAEVMRELTVSKSSAYALIRRMPHVKDGRILRVKRTDFEAWLKAQTRPEVPPLRRQTTKQFLIRLALERQRKGLSEPPRIRPTRPRETLPFEPERGPIRLTRQPVKLPFDQPL